MTVAFGTSMPTSITLVATSTSASPRANVSIAAVFCFDGSWPWISSTRRPSNSVVRSRSYSTVAALACSASDSSTSGQTTKHCRPALDLLADALVGARPGAGAVDDERLDRPAPLAGAGAARSRRGRRRRSARACAGSAWRSCAGSAARGPRAPSRRARRAGAPRSGAARRRPPRRGRGTPRRGSIRACVPTTSWSCPLASRSSSSRRRAAVVDPVSSSSGERAAEQRVERAVVLLGERLGGRHQRGLRAVLDRAQHRLQGDDRLARSDLAHQQPLHRALARRGRRRCPPSRSTWSSVSSNGSDQRQRSTTTPRAASGRARRPSRRARRRPATASWSRNSSSNASRRRAPCSSSSRSGKCDGRERRRAVRQRLGHAQRGRQRLDRGEHARVGLPHQLAQLGGADALGRGVHRHEPDRVDRAPPPRRRTARTRSPRTRRGGAACRAAAPGEPSPSWRAIQGWLNQTATSGPLSSKTRASTRLRRRSRIGLTVTPRTATATVASSPTPSSPTSRTSRRSRWACGRCSIRSPQVAMPSRSSAFGPVDRLGAAGSGFG